MVCTYMHTHVKCITDITGLLIFQNCNDFLAGDLIRSRTRFAALDETGVIGIACQHEHPFRFYSLRHGERCIIIVHICMHTCYVLIGFPTLCMLWSI